MRPLLALVLLLGAAAVPGPAWAAQNCRVNAPSMAFGQYDAGATAPLDVAAVMSVRCTGNPAGPFVVSIGPGLNGRVDLRALLSGTETLAYQLFLDAARTRLWGDGTAGTQRLTVNPLDPGRKRPREADVPVYGRIPAGQDPAPGVYADTVVITVEF